MQVEQSLQQGVDVVQGWNMALKNPHLEFPSSAEGIDAHIKQRISGNLKVRGTALEDQSGGS